MKRHSFNSEVVLRGIRGDVTRKHSFNRFLDLSKQLGYTVRVTGGVFLTHEIDCTEEDFQIILDLYRGT
jgi:hypothetical protein